MRKEEEVATEVSATKNESETVHWDWDRKAVSADQDTLLDLATFFRLESALCQARLDEYRTAEIAAEWHRASPRTPQEVRRFYQGTELYIWELCKWHADQTYGPYRERVARAMQLFPRNSHPRVLDFGAGIATASLEFAKAGYEVTLADVPGATLAFAQHRFRRRDLSCDVIEVTDDVPNLPDDFFDVIVSFDVLEHVPDAERILKRLIRSLRVDGGAVIVANFTDHGDHPQHLPSNIERFERFAWEWALVGAGLRFHESGLLLKAGVGYALPRKIRWFLHSRLPFLPWWLVYRGAEDRRSFRKR